MTAQPPPVDNGSTSIADLVLADVADRKRLGIERYGVALQADNGRDALRDAYEEALDLCMYLRQAIAERNAARGMAQRAYLAEMRADLDALTAEISAGVEPPTDLMALAEQVIASQPALDTPESVHAWAERLAASSMVADRDYDGFVPRLATYTVPAYRPCECARCGAWCATGPCTTCMEQRR